MTIIKPIYEDLTCRISVLEKEIEKNRNSINELNRLKLIAEETAKNYKLAFNSTGKANSVVDTKGFVQLQNQLAIELSGKDWSGHTVFETFGEEAGSLIVDRVNRIVKTGVPEIFETEFTRNEEKKWIRSDYQPIFDENSKVTAVQIISQDMTEIKKTEQKLIEGNEKKEEYNQLLLKAYQELQSSEEKIRASNDELMKITCALKESNIELIKAKKKAEESDSLKTAFLNNLSHEIRTPLNAISGFSGMLSNPNLLEEKRSNFINIVQNSCNHLVAIVSDILTISSLETKQEKVNISYVCINKLLNELLDIYEARSSNQNVSMHVNQALNDHESKIFTDKTKLLQIFNNLISNALKFTHSGFIEIGYQLQASDIEFYVKDTGIGVDLELQEKIFERFRQADLSLNKRYGGTGIGLSISKGFVEIMGGKIWVKSEPGKGSTFYFTIPYNPVHEIYNINRPGKQKENINTILVAEDEEYNFLFIKEVLIDQKLKLLRAKDGKETVDIFNANPDIDLILMDIKMPVMDGYEAAKIIKGQKPGQQIIAQTAYALQQEREMYEGVFDDYLTKPINEDDLKQKVLKYFDLQANNHS
jgi:PAS domain S-box-containing protein